MMKHDLRACLLLLITVLSVRWVAGSEPASGPDFRVGWASLPTDAQTTDSLAADEPLRTPDLASLMRPRWRLVAEWEPTRDGLAIGTYEARVTVPTYPIYGPPPPLVSAGFSYTDLLSPAEYDLPPSLYDFTLGASWIRPLHDRWMLRLMVSAAFASDLNNTSGDAWQIRGGLFATYRWNPDLQLLVGAFASGRDDIPVLPALGAIWRPAPHLQLDLMMPRPRVSYRIADYGGREQWVFFAAGLSGGTWAFDSADGGDRLTYREWRLGLGWESGPPKRRFGPPTLGLQLEAELAYVLGRQFEFDRRPTDIGVGDTLMLRLSTRF